MEKHKANGRRFDLHLPVLITSYGSKRVLYRGKTQSVSSHSVAFTTGAAPEIGSTIEYTISLSPEGSYPVHVHCIGTVFRAASLETVLPLYHVESTISRYKLTRGQNATSEPSPAEMTTFRRSEHNE